MKKKKQKKKTKNKIETLAAHISEMAVAMSFKFGMWTPLAGRKLCSKFDSNPIRDHQDAKV